MYDKDNIEDISERAAKQMPVPVGCHMLILLPKVAEKTDGGIIRPDELRSREETACVVGFVQALGDDCYQDKRLFPTGPWCKKGDWVIFRSYTGTRIVVHSYEMRLLKDNEICAVVANPSGVIRSQRA